MLKEYLDVEIYNAIIKNFNFNDINEIRMRLNQKIIIAIKNKKYFLKDENNDFIIINKFILDNFIKKISENSLYAFNDNIKNGFITLKNGVRVGLCGTVVSRGEEIITIKDFQAVNIRIPHEIKNCSLPAYNFLVEDRVRNTLIISAPGCGKTTFLKDFIYQLNEQNVPLNIMIVDERCEIYTNQNQETFQDMGAFCDVYTNCSKSFALRNGIRSMSPDVIFTDEIDLNNDFESIVEAMNCGVNIVATIHAKDIKELRRKKGFDEVLVNKLFSRFVVLTNEQGPGTLSQIYDERLNCIYCKTT